MLRTVVALAALSVLTACSGAGDHPGIEPIVVPEAADQAVGGPGDAAAAGADAVEGDAAGADAVEGDAAGADAVPDPVDSVEVVGDAGVAADAAPVAGAGLDAGADADADPDAGADAGADPDADADIDVTTVPDTITPAYVGAVLAELEALYAGALASHVAAGELTLETTTKLGSAFIEPAYAGRLQHFIRIGEEGFLEIAAAERIRPRTHTDVRLLVVEEDCVYAETRLDVSPVRRDPLPVGVSFVHLGPRDREIYDDVNPTPWLIHRMPAGDPEQLRGLDPCAD